MHEDLSFEVASIKPDQSATIGVETCMTLWQKLFAALACLAFLGCGSSEPDSPLVLGRNRGEITPGPQKLNALQQSALHSAVSSAGEACTAIELAYLREFREGAESWNVRCPEGLYTVEVLADGRVPFVERCFGRVSGAECFGRRYRTAQEDPAPLQLNPDLGKLLDQMDSKAKKD